MSDDLVERLRRIDTHDVATRNEAADCIEELTAECRDLTTRAEAAEEAHSEALAERDTLAEMVRLLDRIVQIHAEAGHDRLVTDDAEYQRCSPSCRRPAGHAGPHSDLPREGER